MQKLAKYCKASTEIDLKELPVAKKKFLDKHSIRHQKLWNGIHGFIVDTDKNTRLDKQDLKKLINDPDFRWMDINSIGF